MALRYHLVIVFFILQAAHSEDSNGITTAFDHHLYESVLDSEQCDLQLKFLANSTLVLKFVDASARLPSGILTGNLHDLGDYFECLRINEVVEGMEIQGKYCAVTVPLLEDMPWLGTEKEMVQFQGNNRLQDNVLALLGIRKSVSHRMASSVPGASQLVLGVCIPRVCNTTAAVNLVLEPLTLLNLRYSESYCRLPDDKPYAVADYVAIIVFSALGCLLIASTSFDLYCVFVLQRESSQVSTLYGSFSVVRNTRRLLWFPPAADGLHCADGVRVLSMMWVIIGHTYTTTSFGHIHNITDVIKWVSKLSSTWLSSAPFVVDSFFMLSGLLAVYSTLGKASRGQFIRGLHLFYLHRLLRMFPLLAAVILLQASVFNYVSDGPYWHYMAAFTENCRKYWLTTLLHVQNYVNPDEICLPHSWYLSVDTQLYVLSPLALVLMFGRRGLAWLALGAALCLSLISSSYYSFTYNFSAALNSPVPSEILLYMRVYYYNTLCRAPPFFVGMFYGYLLHLCRGKTVHISKIYVTLLWVMSFALMAFCIFSMYPVMQPQHSAQLFDNFLNAYMRAIWALALGWLLFACVHGYGGPINWFLSLRLWKLPARLSYAMYLIHFPIMVTATGSWTKSFYFTEGLNLYRFMADVTLTFLAAFVLCVAIDAPFSTLQKMLLGGEACRHFQNRISKPPENVVEDGLRIKTTLRRNS